MPLKTNLDSASIPLREMEVRLPSAGIPYIGEFPNFPKSVVVTPYSFMTESLLISSRGWFDKIRDMLAKVAKLPEGFNPLDLIQGDAYFIFACARALTYGEIYTFPSVCPECGTKETHKMKVPEELPVHCWVREEDELPEFKKLSGAAVNTPENMLKRGGSRVSDDYFRLTLPTIKDDIVFKYISMDDDRALSERYKQIEKLGARDTAGRKEISRIASHIVSVNETTGTLAETEDYVARIVGEDMVALQDALRTRSCGIIFDGTVTCENPSCGAEYEHSIPLRREFFRRSRG